MTFSPARRASTGSHAFALLLTGLLLVFAAGCDSDDEELVPLSGSFEATTLRGQFTNNNEPRDLLAGGGGLRLTFDEDGSVEGVFAVPPGVADATSQPLSGTYELEAGGDLRFDFDAPAEPNQLSVFIRRGGIDWTYADGEIVGTLNGFEAILARQQ